ncbi:IS200/IS605 family transposase [bacterium]|nr:IS200/IS605 family transposase [bacterium]
MKMKFKSNRNIVYNCQYHLIWCVKYRRKVLIDAVEIRLKEILSEVAKDLKTEIEEMETDKDHVHLLISCDLQFGIHQIVKRMKGSSSRILRNEFPHLKSRIPSLWTNSYFVATVGGAPLSIIKQYIRDQQIV